MKAGTAALGDSAAVWEKAAFDLRRESGAILTFALTGRRSR